MNTFTNKVVVITGGNSGMGLAAAQEFSRRGAKVVISGRDEKTLVEAAASPSIKNRSSPLSTWPPNQCRPTSVFTRSSFAASPHSKRLSTA
jgi:NAD(P)-dependent dehydrogenase (short-subunit alcohol dehydrogenase family)